MKTFLGFASSVFGSILLGESKEQLERTFLITPHFSTGLKIMMFLLFITLFPISASLLVSQIDCVKLSNNSVQY